MSSEGRRRPLHPLLGAGLLALLALLALAGIKSYRELGAARAREARIETEIRTAEERRARLTERIELLQNDPAALEREVRRSLRWVGEGEVVLVVPEPVPAPDEARPPSEPAVATDQTPG
jgi:cell division protein FtsB